MTVSNMQHSGLPEFEEELEAEYEGEEFDLGGVISGLLGESEYEGELEGEYELEGEWEGEYEDEGERMANPLRRVYPDAMMEHLGHAAAEAETEAEAEAFIGALVPLAAGLARSAAPHIARSTPQLVRGLSTVARTLRRNPATRPLVRALPTVTRHRVSVASVNDVGDMAFRRRRTPGGNGSAPSQGQSGGTSSAADPLVREDLTDLASYPVLTEEITTTGAPAPADGGRPGTGYGQAVEQVMRDVLGWRPSADVGGFQAALAGAFQLKEVEGHTEWKWQQRGYAVQADMGALTGAQASIYARAKSALEQIQPLLAGLTPLNPALYPPQDLETIRTVVTAELTELVSELGIEGGPRIQRVDQLFDELLGPSGNPPNMDPDRVRGQIGLLRDRFGLTVDQVKTLDEERIVTNFRVVVDQALALNASWRTDRDLFSRDVFSGKASQTSFGTTLIWLSRSLEAVSESVDDLNFALDSVFVDAAQRQVIELRFGHGSAGVRSGLPSPGRPGEVPIILSDLLDWVVRACRDEGPRMIQDAGKDGVVAFSRVLRELQKLVRGTIQLSLTDRRLPDGLRTPRVKRAFQVLAKQLREAANLASSVRRDEAPEITAAFPQPATGRAGSQVPVHLFGHNFGTGASAVFRSGSTERPAQQTEVVQPNFAVALFSGSWMKFGETGRLSLINEDGTRSNEVEVEL